MEGNKPQATMEGNSPRLMVETLMEFLGEEIQEEDNKSRKAGTYKNFKCPNEECTRPHRLYLLKKGSGYSNPLDHLLSCAANCDKDYLLRMFRSKRHAIDTGGIHNHFFIPKINGVPEEAKAIKKWIRLILKGSPIDIVEDDDYRNFAESKFIFSREKVKEVMFKLCEYIENIIGAEMKDAGRGAIMHDGWSKFGVHYLGVMAVYVKTTRIKKSTQSYEIDEVKVVLLSVAPMLRHTAVMADHVDHDDDNPADQVAVTLCATTMNVHVQSTLRKFYRTSWSWVKCLNTDRASVNLAAANKGNKPVVGCKSHAWDHDVNESFSGNEQLNNCLNKCHRCQKDVKGSVKKATLLSTFTHLQPTLHNATRWSGKHLSMSKMSKLTPGLIAMQNSGRLEEEFNDALFLFSTGVLEDEFTNKLNRFLVDLKEADDCTKGLQRRALPLYMGMKTISIARRNINNNNGSSMRIGNVHTGVNSEKRNNPHFETGVEKIQSNLSNEMTDLEKMLVSPCALILVMMMWLMNCH